MEIILLTRLPTLLEVTYLIIVEILTKETFHLLWCTLGICGCYQYMYSAEVQTIIFLWSFEIRLGILGNQNSLIFLDSFSKQFKMLVSIWFILHGHQSRSFIAYTNATKLSVSSFFRPKFRKRTMLCDETFIGLLGTGIV